ncbi:chitooligosaccharidolytic beta-N-acetylglucosaminidase-like [Amphibalanus amphitrite]|uniref:chitooligosaccharidolytic beta-N-acetylglucosaminidase-like n=1 Tax=Amphibalanus amphitrite TaxID=1232801 RepID=UPI001C9271E3|nr:chitooligosaccharidolytic beta-N-acetylglucosaminidase-like [Amphibalanus amphitrite]
MRLLLLCCALAAARAEPSVWTWRCESGSCVRRPAAGVTDGMQLGTCKLTCGELSAVWPRPTGPAAFGSETVPFLIDSVQFQLVAPDPVKPMLQTATEIFLDSLRALQPSGLGGRRAGCRPDGACEPAVAEQAVKVTVAVESADSALTLETSEDSQLVVSYTTGSEVSVVINATTFFGARHALETLSQLIEYDDENACLQILSSASLSDAPVYPIRALTIDTARSFIPLSALRRTIDAMAMNKLNTLHWHVTDTHSFPIEVSSEPRLVQYGAYSPQKVYSAREVAELVQYGRQRGVRLLPELDAPAHVGYGWQWGEDAGLGRLAVCVGEEPWQTYCVEPPCGQMNIINDNMYTVLEKIYKDFNTLFQPDIFHMGGDEININCWKTSPEIADYVSDHGGDPTDDSEYMELWAQYQLRAADIWRNVSGRDTPLLLWTSDLTSQEASGASSVLPPSQYIIQVWTTGSDQQIGDLLQQGYPLVISNYDAWYFDCGFSAWVGAGHNWCAPYKSWQTVYDNSPRAIARSFEPSGADYASQVRGGSAALWSEQSDAQTLDSRLWPRGAALAERLWAEPDTDSAAALTRLVHHRERMVQRGIGAELMQPEYCHMNDGICVL